MPKLGWVSEGKPGGRSRVWWSEPCVRERKNMAARVCEGQFLQSFSRNLDIPQSLCVAKYL
ncbi:unnamed protein product [Prunus armeniaca]